MKSYTTEKKEDRYIPKESPLGPTRNGDPIEDRIWISIMFEFMKVDDENIVFEQKHFEGMAEKLNKALPVRKGITLGIF